MAPILPPDVLAIVEPENLETIYIDGILPPDFDRNRFVVRGFENVVAEGRVKKVVRLRVAMSPLNFRDAVRAANAAALVSVIKRPKKLKLV